MSDDHPPNDHPSDHLPYSVDTIRMRISWPAAPASRGYNGRMWRMRPLRGWSGAGVLNRAQFDAVTRTVNRGGLKSQEWWDTYQRALRAFNLGQ